GRRHTIRGRACTRRCFLGCGPVIPEDRCSGPAMFFSAVNRDQGRVLITRSAMSAFGAQRTLSSHRRMSESDAVDGAHSAPSKCYRLVCVKARAIQGGEARKRRRRLKFEGIGEDMTT